MDGYLSNKPDNFVDDPEKLYRLMRREAQAKKLEFADPKAEAEGSSESLKESPPQSPRENRLPPMGEQLQPKRKIGELCTPDIVDLPILNLAEIGRPFEIKTSTIRMVQHSPFTSKEDPNLHLQAFIKLCQTFNMDGVTQDQMRARLFPFSLLGKALQWFYSQPAETVQNWDILMRAFMKEYYSPGKTQSLRNKIATWLNILQRLYRRHSSASISTLRRLHITSSRRRISFKSSIKDSPWRQGRSSMHRREDLSSNLRRPKLSLYSRRSWTMTHERHPDAYFRFNPRGTSKESSKWRRKTYSKARLIRLCGGWRRRR
jgi:hypothetical protein